MTALNGASFEVDALLRIVRAVRGARRGDQLVKVVKIPCV